MSPDRSGIPRPRIAWRDVDGVVLLDKPSGPTSTAVLQQVRRLLRAAKGGHAGTLDPLASGMLPLCFGHATKSCGTLLGGRKAYLARLRLGSCTDTGDAEGRTTATAAIPSLEATASAAVVEGLLGVHQQVPPMYSALKHEGRRLYDIARAGGEVERPARRIEVYAVGLRGISGDELEFAVECSTGTYVRVLGEELARRLGTLGHLAALRRQWVEPFAGRPMVTPETLQAWVEQGGDAASPGSRPEWLLPMDAGLEPLAELRLDAAGARALLQGRRIPGTATDGELRRAYAPGGEFLGVVAGTGRGDWRVQRLYVDPQQQLAQGESPARA